MAEYIEWPEVHGNVRLPLMNLQFYGALRKHNSEISARFMSFRTRIIIQIWTFQLVYMMWYAPDKFNIDFFLVHITSYTPAEKSMLDFLYNRSALRLINTFYFVPSCLFIFAFRLTNCFRRFRIHTKHVIYQNNWKETEWFKQGSSTHESPFPREWRKNIRGFYIYLFIILFIYLFIYFIFYLFIFVIFITDFHDISNIVSAFIDTLKCH